MNTLVETKKYDNNGGNSYQKLEKKYVYNYVFDINYEVISPIIKDFQSISQLIKYIQNNQISDLIFILGNNTFSIESRFYFNYRNIIDFYLKVEDFKENDNCIKIKYNIYKTKPISKNFYIILSLFKQEDNTSKIEIEIVLINDAFIYEKILNIIYNEFNYNFLYLSKAIKNMKQNTFSYNSAIFKNEFNVISQIIQNKKLIEYIINGKLEKFEEDKKEFYGIVDNDFKSDNFIHTNDVYKVKLNLKQDKKDWLSIYNIKFKIETLRAKQDKIAIQIKILSDNKDIDINGTSNSNNTNQNNNIINLNLRKLTNNSTFILIKFLWDSSLSENIILVIKKLMKKYLERIGKLCKIAKDRCNS
jgi:hypothetical protein